MNERRISVEQFESILPQICDIETTQSPTNWYPVNPLWGHCAVVSLVAQNVFGGELLRASLESVGLIGSHYWNRFSDGTEHDFTIGQFEHRTPVNLIPVVRERNYVLSYPDTKSRYKILAWRLAKLLFYNPIFNDPIYKECFYSALESGCQKLWVGSVITRNGEVVARAPNSPLEPLKHLCEPECIRLSIQSRTESMIGACSHAEEMVLKEIHQKKIPAGECDIYIASLTTNGFPNFRKDPDYTCLRCAVQMYNAGLRRIYMTSADGCWVEVSPEQAVKEATAYALGQKQIKIK